jgi:hypothetical protein
MGGELGVVVGGMTPLIEGYNVRCVVYRCGEHSQADCLERLA